MRILMIYFCLMIDLTTSLPLQPRSSHNRFKSQEIPREQRAYRHNRSIRNTSQNSEPHGSQSQINQNMLSTFTGDLPDGLSASLQPLNVSTFLYDNQNNHHHHHHHHLHHPVTLTGQYNQKLSRHSVINKCKGRMFMYRIAKIDIHLSICHRYEPTHPQLSRSFYLLTKQQWS